MTQFKFLLILAMAIVPVSFTGCGTSTETSIVETDDTQTAEEDAAYDEDSAAEMDDEDQN